MAQTDEHRWLVTHLAEQLTCVEEGWKPPITDATASGRSCPMIGAYRPDTYSFNPSLRAIRLGEAKTNGDVETDHTERQLIAYFKYLAGKEAGSIHLAVTWKRFDCMFYVARRCRRLAGALAIQYVVYAWAPPDSRIVQLANG